MAQALGRRCYSTDVVRTNENTKKALRSRKWDAVVVGGGHNGLVAACYLAKQGKKVAVVEKRHVLGGAAVTEEIVTDFKFSRCSYVLSLFRPEIIKTLKLHDYGLKLLPRDPSSFTPAREASGDYLLLGSDPKFNHDQIAKFSTQDAKNFPKYESLLERVVDVIEPILDEPPIDMSRKKLKDVLSQAASAMQLVKRMKKSDANVSDVYEIMSAPASTILDRWFESDILKATLATDSVIGAMTSPYSEGSAYVLLHHLMGETNGKRGVWCNVQGGMGGVSQALSRAATDLGVEMFTNTNVKEILCNNGNASGILLDDDTVVDSKIVLSNATPEVTFNKLCRPEDLPDSFKKHVKGIDYSSATLKMNVALDKIPDFLCCNTHGKVGPQHHGTIHLEGSMEEIHQSYVDAVTGIPSKNPVVEMTIPSALDNTLAPEGKHVALFFVQYAPYKLKQGLTWEDPSLKEKFADTVFDKVEQFAPGFKSSVIGRDILSPLDLEREFSLTGGNIFHGSMSLNQLYFMRPAPKFSRYHTPIDGLYLCGAGAHPGGGVMGACGRNAALAALASQSSW